MYNVFRDTKVMHRQLNDSHKVLGIESSCDDTCAAVLDSDGRILSNVKQSQLSDHNSFGGVLPSLSFQMHSAAIEQVVLQSLIDAGITRMHQLSAIAVTTRPGLSMSLTVGLDYARRLSTQYDLPMIPIHHMEAHALTAMLPFRDLKPPFLCLLLSGGHSQLALFKQIDQVLLLGSSVDIAPGDLFDKLARDMKLRNYGPPFDRMAGGEAIERLSAIGVPQLKFGQLPMNRHLSCDFSYAGMSSVARHQVEKSMQQQREVDAPMQQAPNLCASVLDQLCRHVASRLQRAIKFLECSNVLQPQISEPAKIRFQPVDYCNPHPLRIPLVISGGVACSDFITEFIRSYVDRMQTYYDDTDVVVLVPRPHLLCTDNAVMVAWNGLLKLAQDCDSPSDTNRLKSCPTHKPTNPQLLHESNNRLFCLVTNEEKEGVQIEHRAPLGIDIRHVVENFQIPIEMVPDSILNEITKELRVKAKQKNLLLGRIKVT